MIDLYHKFVVYVLMKAAGVYRIYCSETKRNYVGSSSKDWANRRNGHLFLLKRGRHPSKKMQEDWDRFGASAFKFLLICECDSARVLDMEKAACVEFKAFCPEFGYNTAPIGVNRFKCGRRVSSEASVRFTRMVKPEVAKKLASLLELEEGDLLMIEHPATYRGWATKDRVVGLGVVDRDPLVLDDEKKPEPYPIYGSKQEPIPMAIESGEVLRLKSRIRELELKIKEYEQMYG